MEHSTVGSLLRSTQAYCAQLSETQTLQYGIAYHSERFRHVPQANQFREIVVDDAELDDAFEEAQRWFRDRDLKCYRWAPAGGQPDRGFADFLTARGFRRCEYTAMALAKWVEVERTPGVKIVPARALRSALRATFLEGRTDSKTGSTAGREDLAGGAEDLAAGLAAACAERLNDPQFDLFVALVDGKPAGRAALYQVGDIARVTDFHVLAPFAEYDVDRALVAHTLALAKRLAMRNICVQVEDSDRAWRGCLEAQGFVADGTLVEFCLDPCKGTGDPS